MAQLPKHASSACRRDSKDVEPISALARDFVGGKAKAISDNLASNEAIFKEHGVLGLALQLQDRLANRAIVKQTSTYLTMSLASIAEAAQLDGPQAAESLVARHAHVSCLAFASLSVPLIHVCRTMC